MNSIKSYLNGLGRGVRTALLALAVVFVSAGIAQAATTISTNIQTDGTLSVTGVSTMVNASTTQSATIGGPLWVGGNATTTAAGAISTESTLKVGASGNTVSNIVAGYCVIAATTFPANSGIETGSSTPVYADCTPYNSAGTAITSLTAGTGSGASRVFVQATSSLPAYIRLLAASTTATNKVNVEFVNTSTSTTVTSGIYAFNFWSFQ